MKKALYRPLLLHYTFLIEFLFKTDPSFPLTYPLITSDSKCMEIYKYTRAYTYQNEKGGLFRTQNPYQCTGDALDNVMSGIDCTSIHPTLTPTAPTLIPSLTLPSKATRTARAVGSIPKIIRDGT